MDWRFWLSVILDLLIFLAIASVASNIAALKQFFERRPSDALPSDKLVEFGQRTEYSVYSWINPANVTYIEILTGEGGTNIHFIGGQAVHVVEDDPTAVAKRLGFALERATR